MHNQGIVTKFEEYAHPCLSLRSTTLRDQAGSKWQPVHKV